MPYRLNPDDRREVQVKRGERWVRLKLHETVQAALAHLRALLRNVPESHK